RPTASSVRSKGPTEIGGTLRATSSPAGVRSPRNATVRCKRSFAIGRPLERCTASRVAREIADRVASSGQSAKKTRWPVGLSSAGPVITPHEIDEPLERERHRLPAHRLAAARKLSLCDRRAARRRPREVNGADGLARRTTRGTRDAAHGHRERRGESLARAFGHLAYGLLRDRAVLPQR